MVVMNAAWPPPLAWIGFADGKLLEAVEPVTTAFPDLSMATAYPMSAAVPPNAL